LSYILEALRRADAQRELGAVPGIHAQQQPLALDGAGFAHGSIRLWPWATVALLLLSLAVWLLMPAAETPASPQPVAVPASQPEPVVQAPSVENPPVAQAALSSVASPVLSSTATAPRTPSKPVLAPSRVTAAKSIWKFSELPEAIRQAQPTLTVGGAMYSSDAASRMLILNGQVLHEGDTITADLVLEKINLKSAVLAYKGYRYSINF
jgi:general secretion pathway protein B